MRHPIFYMQWIFRFCLPFCSLLLLIAACAHGEEIALDGSWQFSSNHPGDSEDINGFNQRYGLTWNPRVTRAILLDTNMNYSRNVTTGNVIRESFSPTGNLQIENDLFFAQFNGIINKTINSESYDQLDRSWETVLASNWEYPFWPTISLSLGQNWLSDGEQIHVTDTSRHWSEIVAQWELDSFEAYYSYYTQLRDDYVERSSYDEKKHFGRIEYTDSFFSNRVDLDVSGQITDSVTDVAAAAGAGIRVPPTQGFAAVDPLPGSGRLPGLAALIDGNNDRIAFVIKPRQVANLGVKVDLQQVDTLYVYTGPIDPLVIGETNQLGWDLYSSEDGANWIKEGTSQATSYDRDKYRYQVSIGGLKRIYLKLVVTSWPVSLSLPVTEIEPYRNQSDTGGNFTENQEYLRTLADLNLRYTPFADTGFNYSLVWDNSEYNGGNDRLRIFQTANLKWHQSDFLSPSFTVNYTSTTNSEIEDTGQLSYALNIQSILLPTLETNLGMTRNENSTDGVRQTTNHNVHLNVTAALYPNLDSTLDINANFNKNDTQNSSGGSLGLLWTLTARLRQNLLVDFIAEHGTSGLKFDEFIDSPESGGRATLNVNWRPSDLLSILVNGSKGYGEVWSNYENFLFDVNLSLIRTSKSQVVVGYKLNSNEDEITNRFNGNWSWNISEFFTLQSLASYLIRPEENSWFINLRLTSRF